MALTHDMILTWLKTEAGADVAQIEGHTLLFSTALIDSFDMVDLIAWVEGQAAIRFGPLDVSLDNLDSIDRILAFVKTRT